MDVCQPISSLSSAFALPMKMQQQQLQQQPLQRQQRQKQQQLQQLQLQQLQLQQLQLQQQQQQAQQPQDAFSLSPDSLYGHSLDEYTNFANNSYGTDFSADSPLSLGSPVSPTTANPFMLAGARDDFDPWNKIESPVEDNFAFVKPEPGNSPLLFATAFPSLDRDLSVSPAINPLKLSNSGVSAEFGLSAPQQQQQQKQEDEEQDEQESSVSPSPSSPSDAAMKPITMPARDRRYAVRKSTSSSRSSTSAAAGTSQKRKSSSTSSQSRSPRSLSSPAMAPVKQTASQPPKKTAHNLIEKRYRTNLNDKILALRDSVPSLRVAARRVDSMGGSDEEENDNMLMSLAPEVGADAEDLGGLTPAHKLNKATILSKATEYIAHLERRNQDLIRENTNLRGKVDGYEMLVMSRGGQNGVWC